VPGGRERGGDEDDGAAVHHQRQEPVGKINKYEPMYGQKWKRMNMLLGRLEVAYLSTPKRRDGLLQHHLLLLREKLDLTKRPSKMYWALVLLLFFRVSRKGDQPPAAEPDQI
jgi:hypothetical protein